MNKISVSVSFKNFTFLRICLLLTQGVYPDILNKISINKTENQAFIYQTNIASMFKKRAF